MLVLPRRDYCRSQIFAAPTNHTPTVIECRVVCLLGLRELYSTNRRKIKANKAEFYYGAKILREDSQYIKHLSTRYLVKYFCSWYLVFDEILCVMLWILTCGCCGIPELAMDITEHLVSGELRLLLLILITIRSSAIRVCGRKTVKDVWPISCVVLWTFFSNSPEATYHELDIRFTG